MFSRGTQRLSLKVVYYHLKKLFHPRQDRLSKKWEFSNFGDHKFDENFPLLQEIEKDGSLGGGHQSCGMATVFRQSTDTVEKN
jgi:hypothetical protein